MKVNKKLIFYFTVVALSCWCLVIYMFSASTGTASSQQSSRLLNLIRRLGLDVLIPEIIPGAGLGANLRKLAHMSEYFILELLNYLFVYQILRGKQIRIKRVVNASIISVVLSFAYACLDEYHQTFVPGRGGMFSDVIIDFKGVLIGLVFSCLIMIVLYCYRYFKYGNTGFLFES